MDGRPEGRIAAIIHNLLITQKITAMKKQLLFALVAFAALSLNACSKDDSNGDESWKDEPREDVFIEFKDPNFLEALIGEGVDTNGDGRISEKEASVVTSLEIDERRIYHMDEIRYFRALTRLYCQSNQLTSLNVSTLPVLRSLACGGNQLMSLEVNPTLTGLWCGDNQLTSLDISKCVALSDLGCQSNRLTSLDVSKCPALDELGCDNNQLTSLDVTKNHALEILSCYSNQLTSLDISKCKWMQALFCEKNQLKEIRIYKYHELDQGTIDWIISEYGDIITYVE